MVKVFRPSLLAGLTVAAVGIALSVIAVAESGRSSAATPPTFGQQISSHVTGAKTAAVTPTTALQAGDRLIVEVGVWSAGSATAKSVADSAGNNYTELLTLSASDHTELSVWSAPVLVGVGTKPTVTITASNTADIGVVVSDYAGMSTATGNGVVDVSAKTSGTTSAAATVSSGATAATGAANETAIGFYVDSGFGDTLTPGAGFTSRANVSPAGDMEMLVEDQALPTAGATSNASFGTGKNTTWLAAVIAFQSGQQTAPGAPTNVVATAGDAVATLNWTAPSSGGATISMYAITPYESGVAQKATMVMGMPPVTSTTIIGLTNGVAYTFQVTATNAIGTGPAGVSNSATPSPAPSGGSWSAIASSPIVALAQTLLYNGEFVSWDGWQQPEPTVVWNPSSPNTFTTINAPDSVFCDGAATLPDGRLLVIGGYGGLSTGQIGINDTNIFDPSTNTWSRVANMNDPRWYPTLTELPDGRYLAISGNSTNATTWADTPEVYDPATNKWTLLNNIKTTGIHEEEYPFSYLAPNGNVFVMGPEEDDSYFLNVNAQTLTSVGATGQFNGSSVMYLPGKILYSGGAASVVTPKPSNAKTSIIDLNAATPTWQQIAPMNNSRIYHTLTMLADGTVLAVGGSNTSDQGVVTTGVLPTEIWNPATQVWTPAAPIAAARNYHSTAVLMPDGRVLVAGGGHPEGLSDPGQFSQQIYTPAYLTSGARPTITAAAASATYGANFSVTTPDASAITAVNLVSLGADTHQIDMNQHFVPLNYTAGSGTLSVQAPASGAIAPPGYYMLFILKNGVPSVSTMINIGSAQTQTAPATPSAVSAAPGNGSAVVNWTAPATGGSPITSYTVTPYLGSVAQPATTVTGNPPATSATITGLTNGTTYTFTVAAANAIGTGPASAASNAVTPSSSTLAAFVQSGSTQSASSATVAVTPPGAVTAGNTLVAEVSAWNAAHATTSGVTDSAGNVYTKITSSVASDGTELSVWSAPITKGAGTRPTVTAKLTSAADVGISLSEYSGISSSGSASVIDTTAHATGSSNAASTVSSGATAATAAANELAVGFYADSGFSDSLTGGTGWTTRTNQSPNSQMELLSEDQIAGLGATPAATIKSGGATIWLATTVVFATGPPPVATAPGTPTNVVATAGNTTASLSWTAPSNGGAAITAYTVTPYLAGTALSPITTSSGAATTTVTGLTNGASYNFTVAAINSVGSGPVSTLSNAVVPSAAPAPAYVQQVSAQTSGKTSLAVTPTAALSNGNRLVVEVGVWSSANATASAVTDAAGDVFTELVHFTAADGTEMSIWSAPITKGGGAKSAITAKVTKSADVGVVALEYSGLASAAPVDVSATAADMTTSTQAVSSGATAPTTGPSELSIGFYADSGFGHALTGDPGYATRSNLSPNGNMDLLVQDAVVSPGATPAPGTTTAANTVWLAATVVFRSGS